MSEKQTRKEFLQTLTAGGLGIFALSRLSAEGQTKNASSTAKVVLVKNNKAQNDEHVFNAEVIKKMVFDSVRLLSGEKTDKAAWQKFFKPTDVVGLKINCLFGVNASTHPEVAYAVASGVQLAGVKPDNIIIWDRSDNDLSKSGYTINRDNPGIKCYGTGSNYAEDATKQGSFNGRLSKILTEKITALVNIPILKSHGIAGMTFAFKNHYGSFDNPGAHHGNNCDPYLSDLYSIPAIKQKTKLIIGDVIRPLAEGGPGLRNPQYLWDYNGIIAGTDPVAVDYVGLTILDARRKEINIKTLSETGTVKHINSAAKMGLGINDPSKIKIITG